MSEAKGILVLSGPIGSGKTTLSRAVAAALGWKRAEFGEYLRGIARDRKIAAERTALRMIGREMAQDWQQFCAAVMTSGGWHPGEPLVLDGVRHVEALKCVRSIAMPAPVWLLWIDVPRSLRGERYRVKAIETEEAIRESERDWSEVQVDRDFRGIATRVLDGTHDVPNLVADVLLWLRTQGPHAT